MEWYLRIYYNYIQIFLYGSIYTIALTKIVGMIYFKSMGWVEKGQASGIQVLSEIVLKAYQSCSCERRSIAGAGRRDTSSCGPCPPHTPPFRLRAHTILADNYYVYRLIQKWLHNFENPQK